MATMTETAETNDIHLSTLSNRTEQDRLEQQPEISNEASAIAPLELSFTVSLKVFSAAFCFFNAGVNDGSLGVLVPYILRGYNITTAWLAIPYGIAFFGWLLAAIFGGFVRSTLGTGGYIATGAALQLLAQLLRFWKPPFGLFAATWFFVALGQAFQDTQANTFVAIIKNAHRWLGVIHGCYAVGSLVGPLIAAAIASNIEGQWATFYYVPTGIGAFNLGLTVWAFRDEIIFFKRFYGSSTSQHERPRRSIAAKRELAATLKLKSVWLISLFFFLNLGAGIAAGGWVVEYLHAVRGGSLSQVGYISSAFYGGIALGRFVLAEPTFRFGEKRMLLLYAVLTVALQIVFWRVPNIATDAVMIALIGFLQGPCFVTGVSVASKLLPQELQSSSLGESSTIPATLNS
ncbi:uncharacterized protein LTR77_010119 [Saxophila tyrrhenica]|uniref:Major facilitator superfamily (MFS) profile domain-containing protein n=1 Tax=Saxophila tyrrhenica TaxID=1690608 RepID=A0AAV9NZR4_9PEZI|nr:hypothetical protein LTR77_010119 [Saxophila tyrrhenica]